MSAPRTRYPDEALPGLHDRLLAGLRARPGVVSATIASSIPLFGQTFEANLERVTPELGLPQSFVPTVVRPGFFETLRIPLLAGRDFETADSPQGQRVVIINETLRASLFPDQSPIGQRLRSDFWKHLEPPVAANEEPAEIIGVVGDVRRYGLQVAAGSQAFFPYSQYMPRTADVIVRFETAREAALAKQLPNWLRELEPELPIAGERGPWSGDCRASGYCRCCCPASPPPVSRSQRSECTQRCPMRRRSAPANLGFAPRSVHPRGTSSGAPDFDPMSFARAAGMVTLVAVLACAAPALRAVRLVPASALRRE
ncbi:MAG: ABC transporter permease [Deltaproteobacteria bacterium]